MNGFGSVTGNDAPLGGGILNLDTVIGVVCAPAGGANVHGDQVDDCWP